MPPSVLILAPPDDPHSTVISWALARNAIACHCAPSTPYGDGALFSITSDHASEHAACSAFDFNDVASVWHRRPKPPRRPDCLDADREFIELEWKKLQSNFLALSTTLTGALWINEPAAATNAENKLVQLRAARRAGLAFPECVVTNDADEVRKLIRRHGRIVFKTFMPHLWQNADDGSYHAASVVLLDDDSDLSDASIALCPGIFQRYVEKTLDIRTTIIGDRMFSIGIRGRSGIAYLDWRPNINSDDFEVSEVKLDSAIEQKLKRLFEELGIVFGCVDFAVDPSGGLHFLEVNQAGQFLFVEQQVPDLPILQAMTAMLMTGRTDYRLEDSVAVRFCDYFGEGADTGLAEAGRRDLVLPQPSME